MPQDELIIEETLRPTDPTVEPVEIRRCERCNKILTSDNESSLYEGYCKECEDSLVKCDDCNEIIDINDSYYVESMDKHICQSCYDDRYTTCTHCGDIVYSDDTTYIEDLRGYVCEDCYNDLNCFRCNSCDCYYSEEEWHDGDLCSDCSEEENDDSIIQEYSTRVNYHTRMFQRTDTDNPKSKLFYGVELEVLANSVMGQSDLKTANDSAATVYNILGKKNILIKHDGSLHDNGYEIVTAPMTLNRHKEFWEKFFSDKRGDDKYYAPKLKSYNTSCCGMHVHISRKALNLSDICKLVFFINESMNIPFVEFIAARSMNDYCKIKNKGFYELNQIAKNGRSYSGDRYEAVNLTNSDTVEVRIFRGTVEKVSFFKNMEFVDCLIKFVHNRKSFLKLNYIEFLKFLKKEKEKYPNLYNWIVSKSDYNYKEYLLEGK